LVQRLKIILLEGLLLERDRSIHNTLQELNPRLNAPWLQHYRAEL
jgi:hypothetical protein